MRLHPGILALLLTPPGLPSGGFHWQRTITPPPGAPLIQACVVLDAQTFANAAPALRDLRLFQDGFELPYAIEESYDPRALDSGVTPVDDQSLYETVLVANLQARLAPAVAGDGLLRDSRTHRLLKPGEVDAWGGVYDQTALPARVPVERLRLEPAPNSPVSIEVTATLTSSSLHPSPFERVSGSVDPQHPAMPLTLGANLQRQATLGITVEHGLQVYRRAIFEMRRRSLCYQPRSASPLILYLGGGEGVAAKTYSYASNFSTALDRPFATLGPLVPNAEDDAVPVRSRTFIERKRLLLAAALAAAFFIFSARRMLRIPAKRPASR